MKKRIYACILTLALLFCCVSCGQGTAEGEKASKEPAAGTAPADGILTRDEITAYEDLYGKSQEELLEALGLTADDVENQDELSLELSQRRVIAEQDFNQRYDFSIADPEGMYQLSLNAGLPTDTEDLADTVITIYKEALAQYGKPNTYELLEGRISKYLDFIEENGLTGDLVEDWAVSEKTNCRMTVTVMQDLVVISLNYKMAVTP